MTKEKIILDCDPGVDDCVAMLLAFASPREIEILGITTVAGNVPEHIGTENALRICHSAGRHDIPVHAGCQGAMFPAERLAPSSHGLNGLGGVEIDAAQIAVQPQHAVDFIIETVMGNSGQITLCAIGPMTNIAVALLKEPGIAKHLKRIVFMGGAAFCPGNMTPAAEFNFWIDPHAAQIVLRSGIPMTMIGLDVTNKVVMSPAWIDEMRSNSSHLGADVAAMMASYGKSDPCLHDPCVIAYLLEPSLFGGGDAYVEVDCSSVLSRGRSSAATAEFMQAGQVANCAVKTDVDADAVFRLISDRFARLTL